MRKAIDEDTLRALVENGALREIQAVRVGQDDKWGLNARFSGRWLPIRSKREPIRLWASLTAVGRFCEKVGVKHLQVEF